MNSDPRKQHEFSAVPDNQRRGGITLSITWIGYVAVVVDLLVGGGLGSAMPFQSAAVAIVLGNLVLMVIAATAAYLSFKSGCTFALLTRQAFGERLTIGITLSIALVIIGWFSIQSSLFAHFISLQCDWSTYAESALAVVLSLAMAVTAYLGIDALRRLSAIAVPALAAVCLWAWLTPPSNSAPPDGIPTMALLPAISIVIGAWIVGSTTTVGDIMRFAQTAKSAVTGAALGLGVNLILMLLGAAAVHRFGTADLAVVLTSSVGLFGGLTFFALNVWTTNDNAMYSAGLNVAVATKLRHRTAVVIVALVASVVAAWRPYRYEIMIEWLQFLGKVIPPIGAVVFVSAMTPRAGAAHFIAAISMAIGVVIAFGLDIGIAPLNGFIAAGATQAILHRIFGRGRTGGGKDDA